MSNLIRFPGRARPEPEPVAPAAELLALEIECVRARLAQVRAEVRYANARLFSYYARKAVFWAAALWLLSALFGASK